MRDGKNPANAAPPLASPRAHRIIVPVYIPEIDGYFRHCLDVLRMCIESLRHTTAGRASITVVSNGSTQRVVEQLQRFYDDGWIDQLVLNKSNLGKVDAVMAIARGSHEEVITVADCDVLFQPGWLEAVEAIFQAFPRCGFASPVPDPALTWYYSATTLLDAILAGRIGFAKLVPDEDLERFARSVGNPARYSAEHRSGQLFVQSNGTRACIGCGHFVFSMRSAVLVATPRQPSLRAYGDRSEELWLDKPNDQQGFWRLATRRAYAYHMGNVPEPWMHQELERCRQTDRSACPSVALLPRLRTGLTTRLPWALRSFLVSLIRKLTNRKLIFRSTCQPFPAATASEAVHS